MSLDFVLLLGAGITFAAAALFPCIGEVFCEYSGVYSIGLEGIMLIATGTAVVATKYTGDPYYGVLFAVAVGAVIGLLQAVFAVNLRANQVIWGIGLILLGPFLSSLIVQGVYSQAHGEFKVNTMPVLFRESLGYPLNIIFGQDIIVYVSFILALLTWFIMFRTQYGLAVRTTGENPMVAASAGFNVSLIRYISCIVGCAITSIGGAFLLLGVTGEWTFYMTGGLGFLAIALVRLGLFKPYLITLVCLIYGIVNATQLSLQAMTAIVPHQALQVVPYLMGIAALIISGRFGTFAEPAAIGKPFHRESKS